MITNIKNLRSSPSRNIQHTAREGPTDITLSRKTFGNSKTFLRRPTGSQHSARQEAFTLIELLVVMLIIVGMMALLVPAFNAIKGAGDITKGSYDVAGLLDSARAYAIGNNTYVWVGFFEEDVSSTPAATPRPAGTGRVVISAVAATDGSRYKDTTVDPSNPPKFDNSVPRPAGNPVTLVQIGKLLKVDNVHLASVTTGPSRPAVAADYRVGDDLFKKHPSTTGGNAPVYNPTTFCYPLTASPPTYAEYVFDKIIEYNPRGEAIKILDLTTPWLELFLQPTHGNVIDGAAANVVAIQIAGATGQKEVYRP